MTSALETDFCILHANLPYDWLTRHLYCTLRHTSDEN